MEIKEWFISAYDQVVRESGSERMDYRKARDATITRYLDGVEAGHVIPHIPEAAELAGWVFDHTAKRVRKARRTHMRKSATEILEVLSGETTLDLNDPILEWAFPIGDGTDKTLRFWTQDDWVASTVERYRNAAAVTVAARDYDQLAREVVAAMQSRNAVLTGDLFVESLAA